jgi:hypothetical protein
VVFKNFVPKQGLNVFLLQYTFLISFFLSPSFQTPRTMHCWDTNRIKLNIDMRGKKKGGKAAFCSCLAEAQVAIADAFLPFIPTRQF